MPTYVYACRGCQQVIERRQSFRDDPLTMCEQCSGELRRVIQPVGIIFNRATPPAAEREPVAVAASTEATASDTSSSASSSTETQASPAGSDAPAPSPAVGTPAKEPAPAAKEAPAPVPAPAEPKPPADDGHKPAQRGSRWTTFIR